MKKSMIQSLLFMLVLFIADAMQAQRFRVGNPWVGRTYTEQDFGRDNQLFLREADLQMQQFNYEATYFALDNAVAQNPQSAHALLRRANFKKQFGLTTEAAEDIRLAMRLNPYAADLYGHNGPYSILNVIVYEPQNAIQGLTFDRRLSYYYAYIDREFMTEESGSKELALIEEIIMELENDNITEANILVDAMLNLYPESAIAYDLRGVIATKQKDYATAKSAFLEAVTLQPDFAIAWYNFSRLEQQLENATQAKIYLDRAISLKEDLTKAYFDRAILNKALGNKEAAIKDYDKIIELSGETYLEAYLNRGLTRKMLGDFTGALSDLDKAIKAFPDNAELYKNRANLYLFFNYHNRALIDYTRAIELDENFAEAYYNRGLTHFVTYDPVSGCIDMQKSLDLGFEKAEEKIKYFCVE